MTATIEAHRGVITQINVFTVGPDNVEPLIETLQEAAKSVAHVPGWMSINLHVSQDRTQVTNYAQCETQQAWDQVMEILWSTGYIERLNTLGTAHPCLYDVVWSLDRETAQASADPTQHG